MNCCSCICHRPAKEERCNCAGKKIEFFNDVQCAFMSWGCAEHGHQTLGTPMSRPSSKESQIKVVPSGRIDWCGECKKEHGYNCPQDLPTVEEMTHWEQIFAKVNELARAHNSLVQFMRDGK